MLLQFPGLRISPTLFLTFILIYRALTKIQTNSVKYVITPAWSAQVWYPKVPQMLVKYPVLLLIEEDLPLNIDAELSFISITGEDLSSCMAYLQQTCAE